MDEADTGNAAAEIYLKDVLSHKKPEGPKAIGQCLCCEEILPADVRWCDADCRNLWQAEHNKTRGIE